MVVHGWETESYLIFLEKWRNVKKGTNKDDVARELCSAHSWCLIAFQISMQLGIFKFQGRLCSFILLFLKKFSSFIYEYLQ